MPKHLKFIILSLFLAVGVLSQDPPDSHQRVLNLLNARDYDSVSKALIETEQNNLKLFDNNNYSYLLARSLEKNGALSQSIKYYQRTIKSKSVLSEYALWHLAHIMRQSGNLVLERIYLERILAEYPESIILRAASKRILRNSIEMQNNSSAATFAKFGNLANSTSSSETLDREDRVLLGLAKMNSNKPIEAREIFQEIIETSSNTAQPDDYSLAAVSNLDKLDIAPENFGKEVGNLSENTHLERANIYQFNREFELARLHYQTLIDKSQNLQTVEAAHYNIGRGYIQERNYEQALKSFQKILNDFPEGNFAKSALYQSAGALANMDRTNDAVAAYRSYIEQNPDADNIERSYLNIIDAYRDGGEFDSALAASNEQQAAFPGEVGEALAVFARAKIYIATENWQSALSQLDALEQMNLYGKMRVTGGTSKNEITFLRALMHEKLGNTATAIDIYLTIPNGIREYYGGLATDRIRTLRDNRETNAITNDKLKYFKSQLPSAIVSANAESTRVNAEKAYRISPSEELLSKIKKAYELLPDYQSVPSSNSKKTGRTTYSVVPAHFSEAPRHRTIADELLFLGAYDEAAPELERAFLIENGVSKSSDLAPDLQVSLVSIYNLGDNANRATAYFESKWKKMPRDYMLELIPEDQIRFLFPKPYQTSLLKYGKAESVDPRFILSIMRQESRFNANVKSAAAARGLMQFISSTSQKMAEELEIQAFVQDELYDPPTAIQFGAHYLANIYEDFPNQPVAVAASYNGGEDRMARWLKRSRTNDPNRYTSEIVFFQTKDYAEKVMANYRVYKELYDIELKDINQGN